MSEQEEKYTEYSKIVTLDAERELEVFMYKDGDVISVDVNIWDTTTDDCVRLYENVFSLDGYTLAEVMEEALGEISTAMNNLTETVNTLATDVSNDVLK